MSTQKVDTEEKQRIVVYGYVHQYIGIDMETAPNEIIQLIWKWCSDCKVCLLSQSTGERWEISIHEIMNQ